MLIELLLQLFIRIVYTKLFERVHLERFEAVDIEDANEAALLATVVEALVQHTDNVLEKFRIDVLGQGVSRRLRRLNAIRYQHIFIDRLYLTHQKPPAQILGAHPQQIAGDLQVDVVMLWMDFH